MSVALTSEAGDWARRLARTLDVQQIHPQDRPYLERYYAAGGNPRTRQPGPALFLHHFVGSDPAESVHSHPWRWSASLILSGGYREERCTETGAREVRDYRPGDVNVLRPDDRHRIDLLGPDCWTLFLVGDYAQPWGFSPRC